MEFRLGDHVKVNLHYVPVEQRNCDTGVIIGIYCKYPRSRKIKYIRVLFDMPYIKQKYVHISNFDRIDISDFSIIEFLEEEK